VRTDIYQRGRLPFVPRTKLEGDVIRGAYRGGRLSRPGRRWRRTDQSDVGVTDGKGV
jgi:hypothetical protein